MKKHYMYLVFILLTIFSFNMRVDATTKELTCVYEWDADKKERFVVVQESDGSKLMFVTHKKDYKIDSLVYGAWEKTTPADNTKWDSCKKGYVVTSEGAISFKNSDYNIGLETSYNDALSPLIGTEMYIMKDELKSVAAKNGEDIDDYFRTVANLCFNSKQRLGDCTFLYETKKNGSTTYNELTFRYEQYEAAISARNIVGLRLDDNELSLLKNENAEFLEWLRDEFCDENSDDKLCKMVFDYNYIINDENGDTFSSGTCHVVFKSGININFSRSLDFKFNFADNNFFEVQYVLAEGENSYYDVFSTYDYETGDFTFNKNNIHLYPGDSNLKDFGVEYIKKYKEQKGCPNIVLCVDNVAAGGNLNWYLELGSAEEINATGKYSVGICYEFDEEIGQVTDVYVPNEITYNLLSGIITIEGCKDLFTGDEDSEKMLEIIKTLFTLSRISIPLIIIGLGSMDFVKCIFSGNEDGMKKAQNKFMKRLLIGVGIFLVPTLLKFVLELASYVWPNISSDFCGIL